MKTHLFFGSLMLGLLAVSFLYDPYPELDRGKIMFADGGQCDCGDNCKCTQDDHCGCLFDKKPQVHLAMYRDEGDGFTQRGKSTDGALTFDGRLRTFQDPLEPEPETKLIEVELPNNETTPAGFRYHKVPARLVPGQACDIFRPSSNRYCLDRYLGKPIDADSSNWKEVDWSKYLADQYGFQDSYHCPDGSFVDILTPTHAVEVEWVDKWEQSLGQSTHYANMTGRKPGIWLLLRDGNEKETADYIRCLSSAKSKGIDVAVFATYRETTQPPEDAGCMECGTGRKRKAGQTKPLKIKKPTPVKS